MSAQLARQPRRAVHGVLLLDKPVGMSSNHALQRAKRLLRARRPVTPARSIRLASGLLPLCFGAATKFAQACLDADKRYRATLALGERTASGDRETPVIERREVAVDRAAIDAACRRFTGTIDQVPPMHSALKKDGKALYDYARAGVEVERAPRRVTIHRIDVVSWQGSELVLDVSCSKGTYIRTLADDIGQALGCGAHLAALRRTGAGRLDVQDAVTPDALERMTEAERDAWLEPTDCLLTDWPVVRLCRRRSRPVPYRIAPPHRRRRCRRRARVRQRAAGLSGQRPHHRRRVDRRPVVESFGSARDDRH